MTRIPSSPPTVSPLALDEHRPLWSVMIPVYNCAEYIPAAIESVLVQDLGEVFMQIEVVDDASTDSDVEEMVRELGKGRVRYFRHRENVGSLRNFETCINRSKGKLVHLLHGDDRVKPGFYQKMTKLFERYPESGAALCNFNLIDASGKRSHDYSKLSKTEGILKNGFLRIAMLQPIQYVTMVVRREVYEHLGSFYGMPYGEDWEMWVRIARYYSIAYTPEILAEYRFHPGSLSSRLGVLGNSIPHLLHSRALIQQHILDQRLPDRESKLAIEKGKEHCAFYIMGIAEAILREGGNNDKAHGFVKKALELSKSPAVIVKAIKFYLLMPFMLTWRDLKRGNKLLYIKIRKMFRS